MTRITDEAVEAAALAMFADEHCDKRQMLDVQGNWDSRLNDEDRTLYRSMAHAALEAALPHLEGAAPAIDRGAVREEIRAGLNSALCNGGFPETGWSPSAEVDRITNAVMALIGGAS